MRRLLALILALAVLPIPGASADVPVQVDTGSAWQAERPERETSGTERGCSVFFHVCSCHVQMSSAPVVGNVLVTAIDAARGGSIASDSDLVATRNADPPPLPPPIA